MYILVCDCQTPLLERKKNKSSFRLASPDSLGNDSEVEVQKYLWVGWRRHDGLDGKIRRFHGGFLVTYRGDEGGFCGLMPSHVVLCHQGCFWIFAANSVRLLCIVALARAWPG